MLYVSVSTDISLVLDHLSNFFQLSIVAPWQPSKLQFKFLNFIPIPKFRKLIIGRGIKPLNLDLHNFGLPELIRLTFLHVFNYKIPANFSTFLERWTTWRLNAKLRHNSYAIIPSDYIKYLKIPDNCSVWLEIRWHHLIANSMRPKIQLDYPIKQVDWKWEEDFQRIYPKLSGCIVYSAMAKKSFIQAGYVNCPMEIVALKSRNLLELSLKPTTRTKSEILYVGREPLDKGLDLAVSVSLALKMNINIVGSYSWETLKWLEKFSNVKLLGLVPHLELRKLMTESRFLLCPTIESYGLTIVEALAVGLPVVTTPMAGVTELVKSNSNLYLSESLKVDDLVNKSRDCINESKMISKLDTSIVSLITTETNKSWESLAKKIVFSYR